MRRPRTVIRAYGIKSHHGPVATVYSCPCCDHSEKFQNGLRGAGRGHGLRNGGGCYSRMVAHVRREHPEQAK
jgi:hypothetical protein